MGENLSFDSLKLDNHCILVGGVTLDGGKETSSMTFPSRKDLVQLVEESSPIPTTSLLTKGLFTTEESKSEDEKAIRNITRWR